MLFIFYFYRLYFYFVGRQPRACVNLTFTRIVIFLNWEMKCDVYVVCGLNKGAFGLIRKVNVLNRGLTAAAGELPVRENRTREADFPQAQERPLVSALQGRCRVRRFDVSPPPDLLIAFCFLSYSIYIFMYLI